MGTVMEKRDEFGLGFEATELRLGMPGDGEAVKGSGKRGFSETIDLKLKLSADVEEEKGDMEKMKRIPSVTSLVSGAVVDPAKPPAAKVQVVGWPPVRSYRKNALSVRFDKAVKEEVEKPSNNTTFVKVSMDGAPYLRKVDLKMYKSYQELSKALDTMFNSPAIGKCDGVNGRDFMNESKLMDLISGSEFVPTYEDKDGDWMLVGDVPWVMFVDSCKRLRLMKGSDAIGIAPRAMEKCKSRT